MFSCTCPFYDVVSISNEQLEVGVNVEGAEGKRRTTRQHSLLSGLADRLATSNPTSVPNPSGPIRVSCPHARISVDPELALPSRGHGASSCSGQMR